MPQSAMLPAGLLPELFPHLRGLEMEGVQVTAEAVVIFARSAAAGGAACLSCGAWSARVRSRYARRLADGAAGGRW